MAVKCPRCERENNDDAALCLHCGAMIVRSTRKLSLIDNRYELMDTVKAGAMGCVYKARDIRLDTVVALKKMLPSFTTQEELKYAEERFREEAKLLSKLHHGGLPKVSDYFSAVDPETGKPAHYLVMTFIEGKDLETVFAQRKPPFPVEEVLRYANRLLEILTYLHSQSPPVIYRDLNPRNIIEKDGELFLVDFGIAKVMKPAEKGTAIGTPGYASPEQYKGFAEPRSDLYSLGVLMHYLLTGADPEDSSKPLFTFESIRIFNTLIPEYLDKLIMSMLEVIPDNRPISAEQVRKVLERHSMGDMQKQAQSSRRYGDIYEAIKKNDLAAVKDFLVQGARINEKNKSGFTPLHVAALGGNTEIAEYLLSAGARASVKNQYGYTPSHYAKEMGHRDLAILLLAHEQNETNITPFQKPVSSPTSAGFPSPPAAVSPASSALTKEPAPPMPDSVKATPMPGSVTAPPLSSGSQLPSYRDLQKRKQRPDSWQFDKTKALIYAALLVLVAIAVTIAIYPSVTDPKRKLQNMGVRYSGDDFISSARYGKTKAIELFLSSGMDPKTKGVYGETALHWACGEDKRDVEELLLSKKVDVNAKTLNGLTPLHWAAQFGVRPAETAKLLVEKGADVKVKTKEGWTALHWCAFKNDEEMSQFLISKGADVNAACNKGWTPLHVATQGGHKAVAQTLLNNGAKVDMKDKDGWTPLFWAIQEGSLEIVELLLSKNAQVNIKDKEGDTPLKVATRDEKKDIAAILTKHGAK